MGTEDVFIFIFPSIGHSSTVNDVIQGGFNWVVEIIEAFILLGACLNVVTKLLAEGVLSTVVWEVGVNLCRLSNIPFHWSFLETDNNCYSSVVTWSDL